jgi:hypothetical protein
MIETLVADIPTLSGSNPAWDQVPNLSRCIDVHCHVDIVRSLLQND